MMKINLGSAYFNFNFKYIPNFNTMIQFINQVLYLFNLCKNTLIYLNIFF